MKFNDIMKDVNQEGYWYVSITLGKSLLKEGYGKRTADEMARGNI